MFKGRFTDNGGLSFSDFTKEKLKFFMRKNPGMPFELTPILPESRKQRNWFEGTICPLIAFYQEDMDHRDWRDCRNVHEWLKSEFNSEMVNVGGKINKVAQSTKGQLNKGFIERVMDWLIENYSPPQEALDTKKYEYWRDAIYGDGGSETYIDYLIEKKIL